MALFSCLMCTVLLWAASNIAFSAAQQHVFLTSNNPAPCHNNNVDLICHYPDVMERMNEQLRYIATTPSWRMNGQILFPDGVVFSLGTINQTASRLRVRIDPSTFTGDPVSFTCYLPLNGGGEDSASTMVDPQDIPSSPVINNVNSLNTSISLNWTHDRTCFESASLEYHVLVNTDTQPVITDQLTAEIGDIVFGRDYTVSVMAVVDNSQRSEPDTERVTAGYPSTRGNSSHHCFDRHFKLTCHHKYEPTVPHVWCMDGIPVEHDGREFDINHDDRSITLMNVSQNRYGERNTSFQCCVNLTGGPQVCGEQYTFDPLELPTAPTVRRVRVEQTSISLSWEISKACFESVDFTVTISWSSASSEVRAVNVSGSSYDITGLTPGVRYDITLVAIGDGVQSNFISISATAQSSDKLPVEAIVGITLGALVVVVVSAVVAVAVVLIVLWCKWNDSGTYEADEPTGDGSDESDNIGGGLKYPKQQQQQSMEGLTYITLDRSQPRPIVVRDQNLDVQYTGVKFDT